MKRALITGITGQDGAYLAKFLLEKGYKVFGIVRRSSTPNYWRLQELAILNRITLIPGDMTDSSSLLRAVTISKPDEIYNLAAQSFVGSSFDQPIATEQVDGLGCLNLLEIVRHFNRKIKVYQASTSELYGNGALTEIKQTETTPFYPNSPYAVAKLYAFHTIRVYRESYGIFASNGILFNHESPLRGLDFVTRKITNAAAKIKLGLQKELKLGNLDAKRDWGYAPEYVEGMWRILQNDTPGDYVISTGETHSVREFIKEAFDAVGLNWENYVKIDTHFKRPNDVNYLLGDSAKLEKEIGWKPKTKFKELVKLMIDADLERWKKYLKGEIFAWDAPNHPHEHNIISGEAEYLAQNKAKEITKCRICGNPNLISILDLGEQNFPGKFLGKDEEDSIKLPLHLVKCDDATGCGLVQLKHTINLGEMREETCGSRDGSNKEMTEHLAKMAKVIENLVELNPGDAVLDIGSGDAFLLKAYEKRALERIGICPAAEKFKENYADGIKLVPDFFSADKFKSAFPDKKAKAVTSIAMFSELEAPIEFAKQVKEILHPKGIWVLEQSYMPKMLETNALDAIRKEHIGYYSLKQIEWIAKRAGLKVFDIEFNNINGGSFRCYLCHEDNPRPVNTPELERVRASEFALGLHTSKPFDSFKQRIDKIRLEINHINI